MHTQNTDKRAAILKAGMELIAENGFHGSPTAMIASRAGVGTGTIYRYFADKDQLIHEIFKDIETRLNTLLKNNYPLNQSIRRRLNHYFTSMIGFFITNPLEFKFTGQFYDSPYGIALRRDKIFSESNNHHSCESIKSLFEQGIAEGVIKDLPIVILFALFIGSMISATRDHILGFIEFDQHLLRQMADACWDAIKR